VGGSGEHQVIVADVGCANKTLQYGGYSHKIVQSVITTAFLFGFKDVLYQGIVKARREVAKKI